MKNVFIVSVHLMTRWSVVRKKYILKRKQKGVVFHSQANVVQHTILCFAPAAAVFTITTPVTVLYPAKEYGSICPRNRASRLRITMRQNF